MDLIKREDAILAMRELLSEHMADTAEIRLNELHTAGPEIIRCKDCMYFRKAKDLFTRQHVCWCKLQILGGKDKPMNDETYCSMAERGDKDEHRV